MLHAAKIINLVIRRTSLACGILLAAVIALLPGSAAARVRGTKGLIDGI